MKKNSHDIPKLFRDPAAIVEREKQLHEPHVQPLTELVESLRTNVQMSMTVPNFVPRDIPYFDPWDGGVNAECLFLLEAPGEKAKESGFISRNNNDETAKNFFELNEKVGIPRKCTVSWNIVPWYIGSGNSIRAAKTTDINLGMPHLLRLLDLLHRLRVIVLIGRKAQKAQEILSSTRPGIKLFLSPHPSPLFINNKPGNKEIIIGVLRNVAEYISVVPH